MLVSGPRQNFLKICFYIYMQMHISFLFSPLILPCSHGRQRWPTFIRWDVLTEWGLA